MSTVFVVCCVADHSFRGVLPGVCVSVCDLETPAKEQPNWNLAVESQQNNLTKLPRRFRFHFSCETTNKFCPRSLLTH
jgi:hypothetical protein